MVEKSNKEKAIAVLKSLETGDKKTIENWISASKYIQHNLNVPDGRDALLNYLDEIKQTGTEVNIKRALSDGDFVALHSEYELFGPKVVFDIFRFENGKIVEHWDNIQEKKKTVSGHAMTDGPTQITDIDKTDVNKALLKELVEDVFIGGENDKISDFFDDQKYIQHNPYFADGLSGLLNGLEELAKQGIPMEFTKNHMILGEGNFVLSISEGKWSGEQVSFYDMFRVENSKFVEHWDVIEPIPKQKQWKNQNGKF